MKKKKKIEGNPEQKNENSKVMRKKNKNYLSKVEKFCQQGQDKAPISFAQCAINAFISGLSDYFNLKNIMFLLQNCIVQ